MLKKAFTYFLRVILIVLFFFVGYFVFAFLLSIIGTSPKELSCEQTEEIFISTNGVHLDLILPRDQIPTAFGKEVSIPDGVQFVAFGWGDKGFYLDTPTWAELKFSTAMTAAFLKGGTAMHVTNYRNQREDWFRIPICREQQGLLNQYIMQSFTKGEDGQIIPIPDAGYTKDDEFYEAEGNYNLFRTCNIWVNKALKTIHVKTSIWSPFDRGVLYHLED